MDFSVDLEDIKTKTKTIKAYEKRNCAAFAIPFTSSRHSPKPVIGILVSPDLLDGVTIEETMDLIGLSGAFFKREIVPRRAAASDCIIQAISTRRTSPPLHGAVYISTGALLRLHEEKKLKFGLKDDLIAKLKESIEELHEMCASDKIQEIPLNNPLNQNQEKAVAEIAAPSLEAVREKLVPAFMSGVNERTGSVVSLAEGWTIAITADASKVTEAKQIATLDSRKPEEITIVAEAGGQNRLSALNEAWKRMACGEDRVIIEDAETGIQLLFEMQQAPNTETRSALTLDF